MEHKSVGEEATSLFPRTKLNPTAPCAPNDQIFAFNIFGITNEMSTFAAFLSNEGIFIY